MRLFWESYKCFITWHMLEICCRIIVLLFMKVLLCFFAKYLLRRRIDNDKIIRSTKIKTFKLALFYPTLFRIRYEKAKKIVVQFLLTKSWEYLICYYPESFGTTFMVSLTIVFVAILRSHVLPLNWTYWVLF